MCLPGFTAEEALPKTEEFYKGTEIQLQQKVD